ncbi:MAG TPA: hypothetical protein VKT26_06445, partial [Acetobacteraceae bacterium]|nr:hypothetical protein [Acetobacteraceae bacterium]
MTDLAAKTGIWQGSDEFKAAQAAPVCGVEGPKFRQRCWVVNLNCSAVCSAAIMAICIGCKSPPYAPCWRRPARPEGSRAARHNPKQVSQAKLAIVEQSGRIGVLPRGRANDLSRKVA